MIIGAAMQGLIGLALASAPRAKAEAA